MTIRDLIPPGVVLSSVFYLKDQVNMIILLAQEQMRYQITNLEEREKANGKSVQRLRYGFRREERRRHRAKMSGIAGASHHSIQYASCATSIDRLLMSTCAVTSYYNTMAAQHPGS